MTAFANRLPVGPGSRGGRWHDPEYRRAYHRAWRAAHPEYRDRERLRRARERAREARQDPADIVDLTTTPRPLPGPAHRCPCDCGCRNEVPAVACGFCLMGEHETRGRWADPAYRAARRRRWRASHPGYRRRDNERRARARNKVLIEAPASTTLGVSAEQQTRLRG